MPFTAFLVFGFLTITTLSCAGSQPQSKTSPKKTGAIYLVGRLPGAQWVEHNPPRFGAAQSFETAPAGPNRGILTLENLSDFTARAYLENLKNGLNGLIMKELDPLESDIGTWRRLHLFTARFHSIVYLHTEERQLIVVKLIAYNAETLALLQKDADVYVKNLWIRKL